jgi:FkbM family methyltransferase
MSFAKTFVKPLVPFEAVRAIVGFAVVHPRARRVLNALYGTLPIRQRGQFHGHVGRLFRERTNISMLPGEWTVRFAGKQMKLPLTSERLWLDWDIALAISGHDTEIKETYLSFLRGSEKPATFIDVGANYGTHSLIFLVHGVDVLTIEPNPTCRDYFLEICKMNGVTPHLESVAVGDSNQPLKLSFPEFETWLGSVEPATVEEIQSVRDPLSSTIVQQRKIDDFIQLLKPGRILIKIDAEGFETEVIRGAKETIRSRNPTIIFESNHSGPRSELFDLFHSLDYGIAALPWTGDKFPPPLAKPEFLNHFLGNCLAFPLGAH